VKARKSIPYLLGARAGFQPTAELTIRGGGKPYSNMALMRPREWARRRELAADAHDCIVVRIKRSYAYKSVARRCPNGELPRILNRQEAMAKNPVAVHIAPRAQASSAAKHKRARRQPPSFASVSVLDPFRALREPDRR